MYVDHVSSLFILKMSRAIHEVDLCCHCRYYGTLYEMDDIVVIIWALFSRGLCYFNSAINPVIYNFMSGNTPLYFTKTYLY